MSECPYCTNSFEMNETCHDEFRMWQGLVGPYYTPSVDNQGNLSWTNTGGLPNPNTVNIKGADGASFEIAGIVETVGELPESASGVWLVGTEAPYEGYSYIDGAWASLGQFAIGPRGEQGEPGPAGATGAAAGFGTPTATVDSSTGTPSVTVTTSGPDTAKVFAFAFHNLKGEKGDSGGGAVETVNNVNPDGNGNVSLMATNIPMSDNQSVQTHVSDAETDIAGLKTSILQSSAYAVTANGTTSHSLTGLTADHVVGNWGMFTDSGLTTPIPENAPTCDIEITPSSGSWSITVTNFTSTFYIAPTFIKG